MPKTHSSPPEISLTQHFAQGDSTLRLVLGVVSTIASLWLWAVDPRPVPRMAALLGLIFGLLWTWRFVRRRSQPLAEDRLILDAQTVKLRRNGLEEAIPWGGVSRVELDHDALVVCLIRSEGKELRIDPGYGGLGLSALGELLQKHLLASRVCTEPEHD